MRVLLTLLVFLSASVVADDVTFDVTFDVETIKIEKEKKSLFEYLKGLGKSDCEAFLDNGDALVNASLRAGVEKDWDQMFYYDEQAFELYLRAFGWCDDEPENKQLAKERLVEHEARGKLITCVYHMTVAEDAYIESIVAIDELEDGDQALYHIKLSMWSLDDSEKFCAHDPERLASIKKLKDLIGEITVVLEKSAGEE